MHTNNQKPEKEAKTKTYDPLFDVIANEDEIKVDFERNPPDFIGLVARYCNMVGIDCKSAVTFICGYYGLDEAIVYPVVSRAYIKYIDEFGAKSFMYHLKVRNNFDNEDWQNLPCIPQAVYDNLPNILKTATERVDGRKRDILLTGILGVASGLLSIQGVYKNEVTYPNLFCFIIAPAASGKGVLKYAKTMGSKKLNESNEPISNTDLFIAANISVAKLYKKLSDNNGIGIFFETEADTMKNTFKNDWGAYDDLLRKAFHHEEATLERMDRSIRIGQPRLSAVLSGTPNQVQGIIPDVEGGLFSRFLFYSFKSAPQWNRDNDVSGLSFEEYFSGLSEEFAQIISKSMAAHRFSFTQEQWEIFDNRFEYWFNDFISFYNEDNAGIIYRLANITFRIAMILTAIRFGEQEHPTETPVLYCNDIDFETAFLLAEAYKHHATFVYVTYKNKPVNKKPIDKAIQTFLETLPNEFKKSQAIEVGFQLGIADRTVSKYLTKLLIAKYLEQTEHGFYKKTRINESQNNAPIELPNNVQEDVQDEFGVTIQDENQIEINEVVKDDVKKSDIDRYVGEILEKRNKQGQLSEEDIAKYIANL